MSLANKITIARATLIVPIVIFLTAGRREVALALFLAASAGDVLDGMMARSRHEVSALGKVLDPAVDKALYASLVVSLWTMGTIPLLWLVLFFVPQVALGIGALFLHFLARKVQGSRILGKAASVLTFLAMSLMLANVGYGTVLFYVAVGTTYLAGVDYLIGAMRISHQK
ncbi:MAG TPA: CDP-alcohol phosphatidyltransferase family protein [Candidatus Acetothermia bacterium]|nr:CDP-alcohol phosphatidyltransferase family protein [Candidatus Acetothermia bacterium]